MLKKIFTLIFAVLFLTSCATGPKGYMKKSANNKIFDRRGSKSTKRAPLYNQKYIAKAKHNIARGNHDYDDYDNYNDLFEMENISEANREMYRRILEQELEDSYLERDYRNMRRSSRPYPVLVRTSSRPDLENDKNDNLELKAELEKIKAMLNETRNEVSNYKCPTAKDIEKSTDSSLIKLRTTKKTDNEFTSSNNSHQMQKSVDDQAITSIETIIAPVRSI